MKKVFCTGLGKALFFGLVLMTLLPFFSCSDKTTYITNDPADNRADQFVSQLQSIGYAVNEGSTHLIDPVYMVNYKVMDSCAGNNAGQAYKRFQVPPFPGKSEDATEKTVGLFLLQPYEALVYVGPTPPKGDYFSFTPFLWNRLAGATIPKGDWIFAALADPLNNTQIKVEGGGDPFQKNTIVIFTADSGVNDRIVEQAKAAGYPESMINTYIMPSKLLSMGADVTKNDSFLMVIRTANIYDPQALNDYNNNDNYARVFRVTPKTVPTPLKPYDTPPMADRDYKAESCTLPPYTNCLIQPYVDSKGVTKTLVDSLDDLKNAIIASTSAVQFKSFESVQWWPLSRTVLTNYDPNSPDYHKFVAGEASDTPYIRTSSGGVATNFILGTDDMAVVYGVNHQETGLATYSNFSVYGEKILNPQPTLNYFFGYNNPIWSGVVGMGSKDSKDPIYGLNRFKDSAYNYLPRTNPHAKYLYAVRVLRKAPADSDKHPWVVVPEPNAAEGPASGIALNDPVMIGYRAYVNPGTGHGPSYNDIVPDRVLWFRTK